MRQSEKIYEIESRQKIRKIYQAHFKSVGPCVRMWLGAARTEHLFTSAEVQHEESEVDSDDSA